MKRLILVRHGETVDNLRGVAQGWSDSALSDRGRDQVERLASRILSLGATSLYSSTLDRARTTAAAIASRTSLEPLFLDDLREMNCGDWEGESFDLVRRSNPGLHAQWSSDPHVACPNGESFHDVLLRLRGALAEISRRENGDGIPVVVTHGTALRIFATELLGVPLATARSFAQDNAAINIFERRPERWVLKTWNDASHCGE